jgi:hypothetical protein
MNAFRYWLECVAEAAEECGAVLTDDQIKCLAEAVQSGHENYGLGFYTPPADDRLAVIERDCTVKVKAAQAATEQIRNDFISNICRRRGCRPSQVVLEGGGYASIER